MKIKGNTKGITLLEMLIYLGLFTIIFTTIVTFVLTVAQANQLANRRKGIEKTLIFVNEHLADSFTKVNSVDTANSTFLNNTGVLRLLPSTGYLEYKVVNGKLNFTNASGISNDITTNEFTVNKFYLEEVKNTAGTTVGVKLTFQITSVNNNTTDTIQTLYTFK